MAAPSSRPSPEDLLPLPAPAAAPPCPDRSDGDDGTVGSALHVGLAYPAPSSQRAAGDPGGLVINLVDGLLAARPYTRVTLLVPPEDPDLLRRLNERWGQHVELIPWPRGGASRKRTGQVLGETWQRVMHAVKGRARQQLSNELGYWRANRLKGVRPRALLRALARLLLLAALGAAGWLVVLAAQLVVGSLLPTLRFPGRFLPRRSRPGVAFPEAGCDVWLVPSPGVNPRPAAPLALRVFDSAREYVLEVYPRGRWEGRPEAPLPQPGPGAPTGPPAECLPLFALEPPGPGGPATDLAALRRKYRIGPRFLFYDAPIEEGFKNHCLLIRALGFMKDDEEPPLELVFAHDHPVCSWYPLLLGEVGLTDRIHFLGRVPDEDLRGLYRYALAAPLPAFHEEQGLPALLPALRQGCPVVCADIPAFRRALAGAPEGTLFFPPEEVATMARALDHTLSNRPDFAAAQETLYRNMTRPDWGSLARQMLGFLALVCPAGATPRPRLLPLPSTTSRFTHAA